MLQGLHEIWSRTHGQETGADISSEIESKITDTIIAQLEKGVRPWQQSWTNLGGFPVRSCGKPYRGINVLLLWIEQDIKGYASNMWMGFNTAKELGASVRKGEKGTSVVYSSTFIPKGEKEKAEKDNRDPRKIFLRRTSYVWNVDQIDGLPESYYAKAKLSPTDEEKHKRIDAAEAFFKKIGADVRHGGNTACYVPSEHFIRMPTFEQFAKSAPEDYYATLGHEHIHWTGHKSLLNRDLKPRMVDMESYAAEELVAEIGSAFICARLGISAEPREDHAQYLAHFLKILKNDKKFIFQAASAAQKATGFLFGDVAEDEKPEEAKEAA